MLTPEQKAAIRAEEVFREEIRNEIASARRHQRRGHIAEIFAATHL